MPANEPYRESGKTGRAFLLPLVALAAAAASAFVYTFVAMNLPLAWLRPDDGAQLQRIGDASRTARFE